MSPKIKNPITLGFFKPLVLLPLSLLSGTPPEMIEAIILHELAHIKRNDFLMNIVQTLIETLFFYHPGIWYLSSKIRRERELACDDIALSLTTDRLTYAKALSLAQENMIQNGKLAVAFAGNKNALIERIKRLNTKITMKTNLIEKVTAGLLILAAFLFFSFMIDGNNSGVKEKENLKYSDSDSTKMNKVVVIKQHDTLSGGTKKVVRHIRTDNQDELDSLIIALESCDDPTGEVEKVIEIVLTDPELIDYEEIMRSVQEALREIDMEKIALDMEVARESMDSIRHAVIIDFENLKELKGLDSISRTVQMSVNDAMIVTLEELHQLNLDSIVQQACFEANRAIADLDIEYIIADALEEAQQSLEEEHIRIIKIQKEIEELEKNKSYEQTYEDLKVKEEDLKKQLQELEEEMKEVRQKQKEEGRKSE